MPAPWHSLPIPDAARMPRLAVSLLVALLTGCGSAAREQPPGSLNGYHYAVVSFPNQFALKDHAADDLRRFGLEVLDAKDERLKDAKVANATLWVDLVLDRRPAGESVEARVVDRAGGERYRQRGRGNTQMVAVDEALAGLQPQLGEPPAGGKVIEL
jgi:hypothetical protein